MGHYLNTVASDKNSLEKRIKCNEENQSLDLVAWIFDKLKRIQLFWNYVVGLANRHQNFLKLLGTMADFWRLIFLMIQSKKLSKTSCPVNNFLHVQ